MLMAYPQCNLTGTYLFATQVGYRYHGSRNRTTRCKSNSISCSLFAIDGKIRAESDRQRHRLLVHIVVLGVLLDCVCDVIDSSLVSLATNNSVLVGRVVREPLEEMCFLFQSLDLDPFTKPFLWSNCQPKSKALTSAPTEVTSLLSRGSMARPLTTVAPTAARVATEAFMTFAQHFLTGPEAGRKRAQDGASLAAATWRHFIAA